MMMMMHTDSAPVWRFEQVSVKPDLAGIQSHRSDSHGRAKILKILIMGPVRNKGKGVAVLNVDLKKAPSTISSDRALPVTIRFQI